MQLPVPVVVLAATGSVGQRFVQLLDGHPWFRVVGLTASDRSVGRSVCGSLPLVAAHAYASLGA